MLKLKKKPEMATTSTTTSKVSLKLLINKESKKVLFAEAGKDFVDFLFNLLAIPVGTVIRLLTKHSMVGSLGNLYDSIETMNQNYLVKTNTKEALLKPQAPASLLSHVPLLPDYVCVSRKFYSCHSDKCAFAVTDDQRTVCPGCKGPMTFELPFVAGPESPYVVTSGSDREEGFVKGVVTYMIMDDLVVNPMSTISSIALLNKFNVKEVGALEEKVVHLGMDEGLKLLRASLDSKSVLTTVFLQD